MKQESSTKKLYLPVILAAGALVIIAGLVFSSHSKTANKPSLKDVFSQNQVLSKKEQRAENEKINKMLGGMR
jgi:hypothetical protein